MKTPIRACRLLAMSMAMFLVALTLASHAAPPGGGGGTKVSVTAAYPSEAFQGEELYVVVTGSGFDAGSTASYLVTGTTDTSQVDVLMVEFISPSELKTFIRPKENALVTDYDISVQTSTGRRGKGTTLFRVKLNENTGRPPPPPPTNTEPLARFWHGFTGNGGTTPGTSRLYVFGGDGGYELDYQTMSDHWYYSVANASWTPAPTNSTPPSPRKHMGFSCGGGLCVVANGLRGPSWVKETWIYTEASGIWSQTNCKRYQCPSFRMLPAMAYDSARGYHVLFGGEYEGTHLDDTYTFSNATQRWTLRQPSVSPAARMWAAAAFVAGPVNRVMLLGGQNNYGQDVLCDMWSWTGTKWEEVTQINAYDGPCLHGHSMAWDGARLVVTGGYVDTGDTPNEGVWTFEFTPDGKAGTWTYEPDWYSYFQCTGAGVLHPGARMAYDRPSGAMAFFGGGENVVIAEELTAVAYDDLSVCY
jgi:hypothetical protein